MTLVLVLAALAVLPAGPLPDLNPLGDCGLSCSSRWCPRGSYPSAGATATTTPDEPPRFADDDDDTSSPSPDPCSLPVEQRTGGWFCQEAPQ